MKYKKLLIFAFFFNVTINAFAEIKTVYDCVINDSKISDTSTTKLIKTKVTKKLLSEKFDVQISNGSISGKYVENSKASKVYISNNGFVEGFYSVISYFGDSNNEFYISLDSISISIEPNYFMAKYPYKFIGNINLTSMQLTTISGGCFIRKGTNNYSQN